ncbi:hypothetical protein DL98DRAFT_574155 [Cadophora sp. DSE1049]|nr:hypothetical protein DL98DRAFT_574155 [Cadophora sp. DSE1049]
MITSACGQLTLGDHHPEAPHNMSGSESPSTESAQSDGEEEFESDSKGECDTEEDTDPDSEPKWEELEEARLWKEERVRDHAEAIARTDRKAQIKSSTEHLCKPFFAERNENLARLSILLQQLGPIKDDEFQHHRSRMERYHIAEWGCRVCYVGFQSRGVESAKNSKHDQKLRAKL